MVLEKLSRTSTAEPAPTTPYTFTEFQDNARDRSEGVYIVGDNIPSAKILFSYARCCNPVPGDNVVGIVTIGSGIKVHRTSCHNVEELKEKVKARMVELQWNRQRKGEFMAGIKVTGDDRPGMLNEITSAVISVDNTNIRGVNIDAYDSLFEGLITIYVTDVDHLSRIFDKLRKIKGIKTVERFEG